MKYINRATFEVFDYSRLNDEQLARQFRIENNKLNMYEMETIGSSDFKMLMDIFMNLMFINKEYTRRLGIPTNGLHSSNRTPQFSWDGK
ncbi:MAG: hypothetical protein HRT65_00155 [Flavobacteriaceae bacterium]|nr:hypothetical protein [Flavobacteriaceae bacterium]